MSVLVRIALVAAAVILPLAFVSAARKDRETLVRLATLAVFFSVLLGVSWGGTWAVCLFAAALAMGGLTELSRLPGGGALTWLRFPLVAAVFAMPLLPAPAAAFTLALTSIAAGLLLVRGVRGAGDPGGRVAAAAAVHVVCGTAAMPLVDAHGEGLFLSVIMLLQFNDGFAYVAGRLFGRTPLAPTISPKKTIEGAAGGALGVAALTLLLRSPLLPVLQDHSLVACALLALLVVVVGISGDLLYSVVKRRFAVKDFSSILPGHGGVLDRADSAVAVFPLVAAWAALLA